jgi:phosphate-selective porin OprO/OprP
VRGLAAGDTRTAVQLFAGGDRWLANFAVTGRTVGVVPSGSSVVLTSTPNATTAVAVNVGPQQTYGDQLGVTARLAGTPIKGKDYLVHVGVNASDVLSPPNTTGPAANGSTPLNARAIAFSNTQEIRVDGTKLINTGNLNAKSADTETVEFAAQKQNFLLQAEYSNMRIVRSDGFSSPTFNGYYVSGTWVLTGERRAYNAQSGAFDAIPVAKPFNIKTGDLGAWELGVRYSDINLNYHGGSAGAAPAADGVRGGEERNTSVAINWYPNSVVRFMVDYIHVDLNRLSPSAATYQTAAGAQIGQHYDVIGGRAQFAF